MAENNESSRLFLSGRHVSKPLSGLGGDGTEVSSGSGPGEGGEGRGGEEVDDFRMQPSKRRTGGQRSWQRCFFAKKPLTQDAHLSSSELAI